MTSPARRRRWLRGGVGLTLAVSVRTLSAQSGAWPARPIRLIVVYPTGGVSDSAARLVAERLSLQLGQPVVVENRAGAGGSVGMEAMLKSAADGHTLAFAAVSPLTINPHIMRVPYKGGAQVITDAVSGQFELLTSNPSAALNGFIAQGKLRVLAVTGPSRLPSFPDAPTFSELGHAAANMTSSFGFFASAKVASEILTRLHDQINKVLSQPEIVDKLRKQDNIVRTQTVEQFTQLIQLQHREIAALVRATGIKAE
jgi:tripartite-type tricarboxylate transporter receptor subunit TctC